MATFILSLAVILLSVIGLSIGALVGRPPVRSCGRACERGLGCPGGCEEVRR